MVRSAVKGTARGGKGEGGSKSQNRSRLVLSCLAFLPYHLLSIDDNDNRLDDNYS